MSSQGEDLFLFFDFFVISSLVFRQQFFFSGNTCNLKKIDLSTVFSSYSFILLAFDEFFLLIG